MITKINNVPLAQLQSCPSDILSINLYQDIFSQSELSITEYNAQVSVLLKERLALSLESWPDPVELLERLCEDKVHAQYLEISMNSIYSIAHNKELFAEAILNNDFQVIVSGLNTDSENPDNAYWFPPKFVDLMNGVQKGFSERIAFYEFEVNTDVEDPWRHLTIDSLDYPDDELLVSDILEVAQQYPVNLALNFSAANLPEIWQTFAGKIHGFHWSLGERNPFFMDVRHYHEMGESFRQVEKVKRWEKD